MYIADLHIHSRFSRATSRECDLPHLDQWASRKGIRLLGTGDFTHPAWRAEMQEQLVPAGEGVYALREELRLPEHGPGPAPRFVITGEISCIYKRHGKTRKVHHLILLPSLEAADELAARLEAIGNIRSDGRPILGLDSRDLLELTLTAVPDAELIPAHIWTPHFSLFGAFSGFDTLEECFGDLSGCIHAVETGLSSDPPMNWRVSALDHLTLVSHSDAHSPSKLGREADLLDTGFSYPELVHAIRTGDGFLGTVEFFPEEGKYHLDGHRNCGVCLTPAETEARGGICPVCGKRLTIGVEHRVEILADRPVGFHPPGAKPFESLAPLPEVIAASTGASAAGKKTQALYEQMLRALGPEFSILRDVPEEDIRRIAGPCVAEGIRRLRAGQVERRAGFDGEYGTISLLAPGEIQRLSGQISLFRAEPLRRTERAAATLEKTSSPLAAPPVHTPLNALQETAVTAPESAVAVIAGPGTGKTRTLVARIAWLVEACGVKPGEITAVTFTRQAASEMRSRLEQRLGKKRAASAVTIGTFHSICLRLLEGAHLLAPGDALDISEALLRAHGRKGSGKKLLQDISRVKNGASPEAIGLDLALYEAYRARLRSLGVLDFDDLVIQALTVDTTGRRSFRHILVDEFQDVDDTQYALVRAWAQRGRSLFVIGDRDQSIYGFRGACGEVFRHLAEDLPGLRTIRLEEDYRSTPEIIQAALSVIDRAPGEARILVPRRPSGAPVRLLQAQDSFTEAVAIAKEIGRMTGGVDMLEAQHLAYGRPLWAFSDIAVLCRTHRQLTAIESCLRHDDIPCVVSGREASIDAPEVRGLLAFFRSLSEPADTAALETALRLLWGCTDDQITSVREALQQDSPGAAAGGAVPEDWLVRAEHWRPLVSKEKPRRLVERWSEAYGATPALEHLRDIAVFHSSFQSLWETIALGREADLQRASGRNWASGAVHLMTLHASKGSEFPVVFLAGLDAGVLPLEGGDPSADLAEERRLLYVGMTRARDELILSCGPAPSPFLSDLSSSVVRETLARRERPAQQLRLF